MYSLMENSHKTKHIRNQFVLCTSVFNSVVSLPIETILSHCKVYNLIAIQQGIKSCRIVIDTKSWGRVIIVI